MGIIHFLLFHYVHIAILCATLVTFVSSFVFIRMKSCELAS